MFCNQSRFDLPTAIVTANIFNQLVDSAQTRWLTREHRKLREALPSILEGDAELLNQWAQDENFIKFCQGQETSRRKAAGGKTKGEVFKALTLEKKLQSYCDNLKKSLPFVIFIATYIETASASGKLGCWRKQVACRLNGLCVIDFDHIEGDCRAVWEEAYIRLSDEDKKRILLVYITPSGHGLKVVFMANVNVGNLIDNQRDFSAKLGLNPDEACKDASRGAFLTTREDIILINEEKLFTYENEEFGKKYNDSYHAGKSQPTLDFAPSGADGSNLSSVQGAGENQQGVSGGDGRNVRDAESLTYNGVPYAKIIEAWSAQRFSGKEGASRHEASVVLARDLYIMLDRDTKGVLTLLLAQKWVQEIIEERGEDVERTVNDAATYVKAEESENAKKGKPWLPKMSKEMKAALEASGATESSQPSDVSPQTSPNEDDVYDALPLAKWAEELQQMAEHYPCMKELFQNVHPYKLPAVLFSSAALFGTLMTRAWYHFWYEPELVRRLNYCIFIIGDPGAGKNVIEKFYKKIADPMIQADSCLIDAVNRYKEGRTERSTSTKAQKGEALKRPVVGIRVHPARTATGEFIRHMNAAVVNVQDRKLNLHMFSFDAELDNVNKNNKGGDWKDREILELKAFHNEEDGQMYANQESVTGMFNVYWNFIYTGTPYALHRKVNQRNFGTGMSTRLAVIPLPDKGLAKRHQQVDPDANETLKTWAYRLDRVEGELPIEPLNDETYDWQSSHLEIAEFNGDKADRTLLKRIPYYGIGISLPFILMRHWDEWQESRTLTMDDMDKRLCRLAMEIQYKCQQFFFGEMAYNYFADQNKEFVVRKRSTRYSECFRKLPEEFKTSQYMEVFGCSQQAASRAITRFRNDGIVEVVKYGVYKKMVSELP
ncbi:BT4734/BF3469 family protein [Prevotella communis]|uniref:BT4734/BF3469 family protein n=1 Tax=Prevotella communis TaxID=2913614 RepID=UPI001EDA80D4|nr:BT4734/BF3469 family protein [Prevotella communis]UKK55836.1 hypothetical protein L6476_10240 [Prevotella communis]